MEEGIELVFSKFSSGSARSASPAEDPEEEEGSHTECGEEEGIEEFPESVLSFLQLVKQRSEDAEKLILQDLDSTDTWSEYFPVSKLQPGDDHDYLAQLASEYNEEPETFKRRVLADIEEEDREDLLSGKEAIVREEDPEPADKLDGTDEVITLSYLEVEESCRQKLQEWETEQEKQKDTNRAALNARKAVLEKEIKEQDEKREHWKKAFEKERVTLNTLQQEQQEQLQLDLKRSNEELEQDFKNHQSRINQIEADLVIERKAFEEQKAKAKKCLEELQYKSAVKIQAAFRAHKVYKMYAPMLKQQKEDLKRKKELQRKMDMEKKELEEKIKMKLEEKRRKDEEKRQNEDIAKKRIEEANRKEIFEQEMRQREYEKKKNEEKMRLDKVKLLRLEDKKKQEMNSLPYSSKSGSPTEEGQAIDELNLTVKMAEEPEKKLDEKERQEEHSMFQQEIDVRMKVNNHERITNVESVYNVEPEEVNIASETDSSPFVHNDNSTEAHKNIENKSPPFVLTGTPFTSTEEQILYSQSAVNNIEEQDMSQITGTSQCQSPSSSVALNGGSLSDQAEVKRLAWMKSCKPWSKILRDSQKIVIKKAKQRKSSATKQLPPLKEALILHNSPWQYLEQVTTVTFQDLPGCSLSTLSKCVKLKFLSLRRCGLTALDGLSFCGALQYIDVQENCISFINCEALKNLSVLLLNKNQITSIHGLEDCANLMNLELSFNLITRIAGLESLRNLQRLVLDHNQLISTKALETTPLLTYLDCSYNYLTELEGIQNCGLMQVLKLQGNNLSEIPRLDNHVLMRELYLDDNNLTTLTELSSFWLPLLQVFSASHNSITHLASFNTFISLEELNLTSNCLSALHTVSQWLEGCMHLRKLSISRNPFLQEQNWRFTLQNILPALRLLNDDEITFEDKKGPKAPPGSFLALCQHQISSISKLWHVVNAEERALSSLETLETFCDSLKEVLQLSNVYRYAHEYGDTEVAEGEDPEIPRDHLSHLDLDRSHHSSHIINGPHEDKHKDTKQITFQQARSLIEPPLANAGQSNRSNSRGIIKHQSWQSELSRKDTEQHAREVRAAVLIQSQWRGYVIRRDIHYYTKLHEAACVIQSAWRHYHSGKKSLLKRCATPKTSVTQHAATVIQAAWKGFFLRKRLAAAFAGIDREELEDDFEEVNLEEFTYDENVFEQGWSVDSTRSHSGALHLFSKPEQPKKYVAKDDREYSLPRFPQEAWAISEGSALDRGRSRSEKQNLSHVYSMKSNTDISFKSEKEEKISQEWGFKDASTAQLMLKRAQKMKSKQAKHKKMLDPAVRLALFKNNENKHAPVMPPRKAQPTKIEYFRGKEEELYNLKELPSEALARSRDLTYQWLHTQCGDINPASSATSKCKRFLPELNHDVLKGGRVQLVTNGPLSKDADDLDLLSVKSGSLASHNREEKVKTPRSSGPCSDRNSFAPVKANSGPHRKERISFRDNPVQFSGGWGGGKKKAIK
ncbi:leucine-rich repeat and IQ domain-containing protein 1 [Bufo bufo]|uniref:leucine-rich repeat and IQ domain-containing protein 1 n=1 Tax=Bufo bufo TaxID=8384 RepID=UPI001ABEA94B|nr:leucine-rich repeat and IQ domain-containing protein 1 [Bufo bufo]